MKATRITIFICLSILSHLNAQPRWTYQNCIEYAWKHNLTLKNVAYDTKKQDLNYHSAFYNFLPTVNASAGYDIRNGRSIDPNTNGIVEREFFSNSYGMGADLLLFNSFRKQNQLSFEKYRLIAAESEFERQKNDLAFSVLNAFVDHKINSGLAEIQREQLGLSEREVHRIEKRIDLGLGSGSDLYEAQARLAADKFLLVRYQNLVNTSENELKRLLNLPVDTTLALAGIQTEHNHFTHTGADSITDIAKSELPEVKTTRALLKAAQKEVKIARSSLSPSLGAYANWGSGYYETSVDPEGEVIPFSDQIKNNRNLNYGLSLNIPLFDRLTGRTELQRAKINREQAENNLKMALNEMEYQVNQAMLDWRGAIAEYNSAQKKVNSMALAFEVAMKKREKGLISSMDFYEAKNNLSVAKAELLRTGLQLFLRERTINFYLTGTLIEYNGQEDRR